MIQNEVVGLILKKMKSERRCIDEEGINFVYSNTMEDSALRRLTFKSIKMAMGCGFADDELQSRRRDLNRPHDLAWANDLLAVYTMEGRYRSNKELWEWNYRERQCQWHVHPEGTDCAAATGVSCL